jgi:hypothetical protein
MKRVIYPTFPFLLALLVIVIALSVLPARYAGAQSDVTDFNSVALAGKLRLRPQTVSITGSFIITPTRSNILLTSTLAVTSSTSAAIITSTASAGDLLIIRNDNASDAIVLDGAGGTLECGANITLGADDVVTVMYDGAGDWRCVALRDN